MKITEENKEFIKKKFDSMTNKEDLLELLNYTKGLIYGEKVYPFKIKHLNYHSSPKARGNQYFQFEIKKKSGKSRIINAPSDGLKSLQKCINIILQTVYESELLDVATGFVPGKSILDNAKLHIGKNYVYNIDLKDFFPSIDQARFWKRLQYHPFNLNDEDPNLLTLQLKEGEPIISKNGKYVKGKRNLTFNLKNILKFKERIDIDDNGNIITDVPFFVKKRMVFFFEENSDKESSYISPKSQRLILANIISSICFHYIEVERIDEHGKWNKLYKNVLPQGAPTSPIISNIICQKLDYYLSAVAKRFGLTYSRYADDITFSSDHNVYQKGSEFILEIQRIISSQNFHINSSKIRLQKSGFRQEVTGLIVNQIPNIQKRYVKELRMYLYYWENYGFDRASQYFLPKYKQDKGYYKKGRSNLANVLQGKLEYLKMIKGEDDSSYQKLKARFEKLSGLYNPFDKVLSIWENDGIELAMNEYYSNFNQNMDGKEGNE